jgi:hypothetical protein
MRNLLIDLTAAFFGLFLIILNITLLVAYTCGNTFPTRFSILMLSLAAVVALVNRILVWTRKDYYM